MAENEILDVSGARRWRPTRRLLRDPSAPLQAVADCFIEDADRGIRTVLREAFRKGAPLLVLLKAHQDDRVALRAVIASYPDQGLARVVSDACEVCAGKDPSAVARTAGQMILDRVLEQALLFAGRCDRFQTPESRSDLARALSDRQETYKEQYFKLLEASLNGTRLPRRARTTGVRPTKEARLGSLLSTSLLDPTTKNSNASRHR